MLTATSISLLKKFVTITGSLH